MMASAWGKSWGKSWNGSWGIVNDDVFSPPKAGGGGIISRPWKKPVAKAKHKDKDDDLLVMLI